MDCRSPSRCNACEHFVRGGCALEDALDAALSAMTRAPRAPRLAVTPGWERAVAA